LGFAMVAPAREGVGMRFYSLEIVGENEVPLWRFECVWGEALNESPNNRTSPRAVAFSIT
jgi:hypothetical protein